MISHNKPTLGKEEEFAASRILKSGWIAQGKEVEKFENYFCDFLGVPHGHAVAVSSGTSALYLALWVLKAKNLKVAFPSYVCASIRYAVNMVQANEVIIDSENGSPNISIDELNQSEISIAIVPHIYGNPVDLDKIKTNFIIEDCCQSIGARYNDKQVGLIGDIGIFSFYATKLMTSGGQGGMVVSKNKSWIDEIKDYREFDMRNDKKMRFNFQLTDLQAAIGIEQLKKLPDFLNRREEIFNMYLKAGLPIQTTINQVSNAEPIRYRAILISNKPKELIKKLYDNKITAIIPIEDWELLSATPNALKYSQETISIPIYPSLTNEDVNYIIKTLQ
jgi:perosamine synthetase